MLRVSEIADCPACSDVLTNQNLFPKLTDASSPVAVVVANRDLQILDASQNTLLPRSDNGQIWCTLRVESLQDFLVIHVLDRPGNLSNPHLLCWVNFPTWSIIGLDYSPRPTRSKKFLFSPPPYCKVPKLCRTNFRISSSSVALAGKPSKLSANSANEGCLKNKQKISKTKHL